MALKIANEVAIAMANAATALVDAGATVSKLIVYGGAAPAEPNVAIGAQPVLVTFNLPDPAFGAAADTNPGATSTLNPVTPVQASATGTATFFRIVNGNGLVVQQGTVTDTTGNGDLKLSSTAVISGIDVTVVSGTIIQPEA